MVPLHAAAPLLHELRRARGVSPARSLVWYALEYVSTIYHQAQHLQQRERAESAKLLQMLSVVHFDGRSCRAGGRLKIRRG